MTLQFPNNPSNGQQFTASNGLIYRWDGEKWITLGSAQSTGDIYVQKIGDTMTGQLVLPGGGTGSQAATVNQVDTATGVANAAQTTADAAVVRAGDTMTGDLNLPNLVATGDIQSTSQNGGPLAGFRNQIINGDFRVWQRGATATAPNPTGKSYLADRWSVRGTGGSGGTPTVEFAWGPNKKYAMHRYNAAGLTAGSFVEQTIEAQNIRPMAGKELTASVYSSAAVAISIYYYDASSDIQSIAVETNMTAEGSNRYSYTFTIPDVTIAAFGEDAGLIVRFHYDNAANPLPNGSYDIWNAQLEPGPVATPFEHRPYGTELALCQRYFYVGGRLGLDLATTSGSVKRANYFYPTQMRATPTIANLSTGDGSITNPVNSSKGGYFKTTGSSATTDGSISTDWTAEAEL